MQDLQQSLSLSLKEPGDQQRLTYLGVDHYRVADDDRSSQGEVRMLQFPRGVIMHRILAK